MTTQIDFPERIGWLNAPAFFDSPTLSVTLPDGSWDYKNICRNGMKEGIANLPEYHKGLLKELLTQYLSGAKSPQDGVLAELTMHGTTAFSTPSEIECVKHVLENYF